MTQQKPPALASWMLRHLVPGDKTEALEGDLLEEFHKGRSADWYWRQVAGAILDFSNLLRMGWVMLWTAAFAAAWNYGFGFILVRGPSTQLPYFEWLPYRIPWFIFASMVPFYLALPLCVYLALTHRLSLRAFGVGLAAGVLVIAMLPFICSQLATPFNYFLASVRLRHGSVTPWIFAYGMFQESLPLVVAMWAASLCKKKTVPPTPSQQTHA